MNLAIRVRDYRYAKGWGPDELANRAEISRTALYQIESGKTGLPRAGTLRRIAIALDVTMEELLGNGEVVSGSQASSARAPRKNRSQWLPGEGGPLSLPSEPSLSATSLVSSTGDEHRFSIEKNGRNPASGFESVFLREGELMSKLHDLLHSSLGEGVARIVEDMHGLLPRARASL
jgi:transcriptional regulator with XRE-family HTH domain